MTGASSSPLAASLSSSSSIVVSGKLDDDGNESLADPDRGLVTVDAVDAGDNKLDNGNCRLGVIDGAATIGISSGPTTSVTERSNG